MQGARPAIDWEQAYARLEQVRHALEAGGDRPPAEVQRILRERAQALARPVGEAPTPGEMVALVIFSLAGERYGVEASHVLEVIPLRDVTRVPCTPAFVLGVVNHRGRVLPVLDFGRFFELTGQEITEASRVVAVEAGKLTFGIFADAVVGTVRVGVAAIGPPPAGLAGIRQAFVRGVTPEMVVVLDLEALAQDPRIVVNGKVG